MLYQLLLSVWSYLGKAWVPNGSLENHDGRAATLAAMEASRLVLLCG